MPAPVARIGACLGPAMAAALMLSSPLPASAEAGTICDQPQKPGVPTVVMLLWRGPTEVEEGVLNHVRARDLDLNFVCLSAESRAENIPAMIAKARGMKADLFYSWGTGITLAAVGRIGEVDPTAQITDRPVIFTMVSYPVEAGIVPSFEKPGRNVTGSSHTVPLAAQIRAMQAYRKVSSIGVLYNPLEPNSTINVQQLNELAESEGIDVVALPVQPDAKGRPDPARLPDLIGQLALRQPQFLFIGPDNFIGENRDEVIGEALKQGLPAFTGTELEIAHGRAMVGLVTSYTNLGRYMGSLIERILIDGEAAEDIPVRTLSRFTYMVRLPVARELGLYPPLEVLDFADIVTEPVR